MAEPEHKHCEHLINAYETSAGGVRMFRCCHCGESRTVHTPPPDPVQWTFAPPDETHGPFAPRPFLMN